MNWRVHAREERIARWHRRQNTLRGCLMPRYRNASSCWRLVTSDKDGTGWSTCRKQALVPRCVGRIANNTLTARASRYLVALPFISELPSTRLIFISPTSEGTVKSFNLCCHAVKCSSESRQCAPCDGLDYKTSHRYHCEHGCLTNTLRQAAKKWKSTNLPGWVASLPVLVWRFSAGIST